MSDAPDNLTSLDPEVARVRADALGRVFAATGEALAPLAHGAITLVFWRGGGGESLVTINHSDRKAQARVLARMAEIAPRMIAEWSERVKADGMQLSPDFIRYDQKE